MGRSEPMLEPLSPTSALLAYAAVPSTPLLLYSLIVPVVLSLNGVSSLCSTHLLLFLVASYTASYLFLLFTFSVALHPLPLCHAFHRRSIKVLSLVLLFLLHAGILTHGVLFLLLPAYFPSVLTFAPFIDSDCTSSIPFALAEAGVGLELSVLLWYLSVGLTAQIRRSWWEANPVRRSIEEERLRTAIAQAKERQAQWLLEVRGSSIDKPTASQVPGKPSAESRSDGAPLAKAVQQKSPESVSRNASVKPRDEDEILRFTQRAQEERKRRRESLKQKSQANDSITGRTSFSVKSPEKEERKEADEEAHCGGTSSSPFIPRASGPKTAEGREDGEVQPSEDEDIDSDDDSEEEKEGKGNGAVPGESDEADSDDSDLLEDEEVEDVDGDVPPLPLSARSIPILSPLPVRSAPRGSAAPLPFHPLPRSTKSTPPQSIAPATIISPTPDTLPTSVKPQVEALDATVQQASPAIDHVEGEEAKALLPSETQVKDTDNGAGHIGPLERVEAATPMRRKSSHVTPRNGSEGGGKESAALPIVAVPGPRRRPQLIPLREATPSTEVSSETARSTDVESSISAAPLAERLPPTSLPLSSSQSPPSLVLAPAPASLLLPSSVDVVAPSSSVSVAMEQPSVIDVVVPAEPPAFPPSPLLIASADSVSDAVRSPSDKQGAQDGDMSNSSQHIAPEPAAPTRSSITEVVAEVLDMEVSPTHTPGTAERVEQPESTTDESPQGVSRLVPSNEKETAEAAAAPPVLESVPFPSPSAHESQQLVETKVPIEPEPVLLTAASPASQTVIVPDSAVESPLPSPSATSPASPSSVSTDAGQLRNSSSPSPTPKDTPHHTVTVPAIADQPTDTSVQSGDWEEQLEKEREANSDPTIDLSDRTARSHGDLVDTETTAAAPSSNTGSSSSSIVKVTSLSQRPPHEQRLIVELMQEQGARMRGSSNTSAAIPAAASVQDATTEEEVKKDSAGSVGEDFNASSPISTSKHSENEEEVEWSKERKDETSSPTFTSSIPTSVPFAEVEAEVEVESPAVQSSSPAHSTEEHAADSTSDQLEDAFTL